MSAHLLNQIASCAIVSAGVDQLSGATPCILTSSSAADSPFEVADDIDETALAAVMRTVPLGAAVLAGSAVALLVLGYLLVYILVFIPRGTVG